MAKPVLSNPERRRELLKSRERDSGRQRLAEMPSRRKIERTGKCQTALRMTDISLWFLLVDYTSVHSID
jgi:hypothetical protein